MSKRHLAVQGILAHEVRPDLVAYSLLVQFICVLGQVIKQRHARSSIWTGIELDEVRQNDRRVVFWRDTLSELQHKGKNRSCRSTSKFKCRDEGRQDLVGSELGGKRVGRLLQRPAEVASWGEDQ